ncbi:hypothetical protein GOBAR_AA05027 [Gossypium barbadense]|uniref:Uncharacterized protein n=1 Tax=Gossypium barbadense TaxID=3634 RepID=A0A2P5YIZ5_GOSBA|nr:hypothetical protein GOBAR_AA05027 [Gossypium barbadense]
MGLKKVYEPLSSSSRGPIHEDHKPQIEELDEWQMHKPRTHNKPKLRQNKLNTFPNQLKVGDKVLLDAVDPHIVTTKPNEEIPLTVLSIFSFGTVEVSHPKFGTFKCLTPNLLTELLNTSFPHRHDLSYGRALGRVETGQRFFLARATINHHSSNNARHGRETQPCTRTRPRNTGMGQLSDEPKFKIRESHGLKLGNTGMLPGRLYTEEFKEKNDVDTLNCHIHRSLSRCWDTLVPGSATYNPSCFKASVLPLSLRYLHANLAHTLTGRRESTSIVNTHGAYFLWCMSHGHIIDLAYFIALAIQHQTEQNRKGVMSIGPYVTRLA